MTLTDSTYRALLNSVLHDPADDAPRLILADYLDEHGQAERAELIRVECELERIGKCQTPSIGAVIEGKPAPCYMCRPRHKKDCLPWCESCCKREDLGDRSRELLAAHGERWAMEELVRPCGSGVKWDVTQAMYERMGGMQTRIESKYPWHWSRGFISRVELTTETLMGRVCERCNGRGHHGADPGRVAKPCQHCNGTGRIPGIAAALARAVPLEECVLTDKRPMQGAGGWYWGGAVGQLESHENYLPMSSPIWLATRSGQTPIIYDSEPAAISALSKAAAKWVRKEAGLT